MRYQMRPPGTATQPSPDWRPARRHAPDNTVMTISANMDQRLITLSFTRFVTSCLTRIRLQRAIYFCLHRGQCAEKHCKMASFESAVLCSELMQTQLARHRPMI